ncbi:MAG: glycoside hydrolase family 16 protein [Bacteroidia bacterium]|nr:glycoside hydrolase family 16 protein [Bacteroidia bacterium]
MKNFFPLLILPAFFFAAVSCNQTKTETDNDKWTLVWEDDFKGKQIDTTKWSKIPRGRSDWNNYMSDYDELYAVEDGNLVLRGIQNTVLPNDTAPYLTGGVYTKDKQTFGFGRLEIRAKLNPAIGAWPAFWMLPEEGKWPDGGEIDIMERLNHDKLIYQTVHSSYTQIDSLRLNPPASTIVGMKPDDYNVYALEKYPDSLVFYVNDTRTKNYPRAVTEHEGQFPFADQEFYLLLDMQLGGSWVGAVNPAELPVEMQIDWVRYYEPNEP